MTKNAGLPGPNDHFPVVLCEQSHAYFLQASSHIKIISNYMMQGCWRGRMQAGAWGMSSCGTASVPGCWCTSSMAAAPTLLVTSLPFRQSWSFSLRTWQASLRQACSACTHCCDFVVILVVSVIKQAYCLAAGLSWVHAVGLNRL